MQNKDSYKMYEDKIDKLVHDTFASDVTTNTIGMEWNSLQQRIVQHQVSQKQISKKPLYILAALILISASALVGYNYNSNKNDKNETAYAEINNIASTNKNENNKIIENSTTPNEVLNNDNYKLNIDNSNTQPNIVVTNNNDVNNNNISNILTSIEKINEHKRKLVFSKVKNNSIENISTLNNTINNKKYSYNKATNSNKIKDNGKEKETIDEMAQLDISSITEENPSNKTIETLVNDESIKKDETIAIPPSITNSIIENKNASKTTAPVVTKPKKKTKTREMPEHEFSAEKKWYVEAFSGLNNSIKDKNSFAAFLAPAGYLNKRLNQESNLQSIQAGVQFKIQKNHFLFGSGFNFMQLGDKVNYKNDSVTIFDNANGNTNFTYLELPITAGYEWANKRWGVTLQGGLSAGILMNLSGQYASINNYNTQLFDVKNNKTTFKKAIYNVVFNPQINYFISQNINVFASPIYRRNLQPITTNDADLKQKYNSFGFNFGIRTKLKY